MTFGDKHVATWNDHFPSGVESCMWRCSAAYIIWSGLVWLLINLIAQISKPFDDYWNRTRLSHAPFATLVPLIIVCGLCGSLYIFAWMYLVFMAFISIRTDSTSLSLNHLPWRNMQFLLHLLPIIISRGNAYKFCRAVDRVALNIASHVQSAHTRSNDSHWLSGVSGVIVVRTNNRNIHQPASWEAISPTKKKQ